MKATRSWWKTGIALLLTAVMLFPVYWMLNNSLTRDEDMRRTPPSFFPAHPTLEGYRAVRTSSFPTSPRAWSSGSAPCC
jgi:multiple sugar transport system permease protein